MARGTTCRSDWASPRRPRPTDSVAQSCEILYDLRPTTGGYLIIDRSGLIYIACEHATDSEVALCFEIGPADEESLFEVFDGLSEPITKLLDRRTKSEKVDALRDEIRILVQRASCSETRSPSSGSLSSRAAMQSDKTLAEFDRAELGAHRGQTMRVWEGFGGAEQEGAALVRLWFQ